MTNYQNDIMNLLKGDTPKQKYDNLKQMIEIGAADSAIQHIINHFKSNKDLNEFLFNLDKLLSGITWDGKRQIKSSTFAISGSMIVDMKGDVNNLKGKMEREPYYLSLRKVPTVTLD